MNLSGKLGRSVDNLEKDFCDGVNFILLIGQLEGEASPFHPNKFFSRVLKQSRLGLLMEILCGIR